MVKKLTKKNEETGIFSNFKEIIEVKFHNLVEEFLELNVNKVKEEINNFVEKNITNKIDEYISKIMKKISSILLFIIGSIFIIYSINSIILNFLTVPEIYHSLIFGLILFFIGTIILIKRDKKSNFNY